MILAQTKTIKYTLTEVAAGYGWDANARAFRLAFETDAYVEYDTLLITGFGGYQWESDVMSGRCAGDDVRSYDKDFESPFDGEKLLKKAILSMTHKKAWPTWPQESHSLDNASAE